METFLSYSFQYTHIFVSEGLNSVETGKTEIPVEQIIKVSEGLNSVETQ